MSTTFNESAWLEAHARLFTATSHLQRKAVYGGWTDAEAQEEARKAREDMDAEMAKAKRSD